MKLKDLKEYLDGLSNKDLDRELMVPVYKPGTLGGTPSLSVKEISLGFDWDQGVAHVETGEQLTLLSSEEVSAILTLNSTLKMVCSKPLLVLFVRMWLLRQKKF